MLETMRMDAHQHFWDYSPQAYGWISENMPEIRRTFSPNDLKPVLEKNNIGACISVQARQSIAENNYLLGLAEQHDFIKGVVGWVDFRSDQVDKSLESYMENPWMKGFRHVIQDEPDDEFIIQKDFIKGVKRCQQYGYTYDILIFEKHLSATAQFLEHFDGQAFVLDHIGKPLIGTVLTQNWEEGIRRIAQYKNLHCKVSGMVTEANWKKWRYEDFVPFLDIIVDAFGVDRIMFGSDWPVCLLGAEDYGQVLGIIERYFHSYSEEDQAKIFGLNARKFYNI